MTTSSSPHVALVSDGEPLPWYVQPVEDLDIVAKHAQRAGLADCTAHTLRHTFCTLLAERDVSIEVIRELAGHADIRTTQRYITVADQRRDHAITHTFEDGRRDWLRERGPPRRARVGRTRR